MIQEAGCERYTIRQTTRHTSIRDFFSSVYLCSLSRSSVVILRHTIDELNLWMEMENHKKSPIECFKWERVTQYRNAMNEHFYALSTKNTFLGRTFFCVRLINVISNREKKANKKDYLLLYFFFFSRL